jgi:hypothetical protein
VARTSHLPTLNRADAPGCACHVNSASRYGEQGLAPPVTELRSSEAAAVPRWDVCPYSPLLVSARLSVRQTQPSQCRGRFSARADMSALGYNQFLSCGYRRLYCRVRAA